MPKALFEPMTVSACAFRSHVYTRLSRVGARAWLTQLWLTAARHIFRPPLFANLFAFLPRFHASKIRLNIFTVRGLTISGTLRHDK
jgi:hypothetical protein